MGHIVMMCNFEVDEKIDRKIMQQEEQGESIRPVLLLVL